MGSVKTKKNKRASEKKPTGRPSKYTPELAEKVLSLLEQGVWITKACKEAGVNLSTWILWVNNDIDGLSERSARAREQCYDVIAEDTLRIADDLPLTNPMTGALDGASVQHKRLQIDTRFRLLGKVCPAKYGDSLKLEHGGKVGIETLIAGAGSESSASGD